MATLRALECLVSLVDKGSFTEAAAALHMTQPALSHQIMALERELGTRLVERLPRGVRPTAAGRAAAQEARAALQHAARAITAGRRAARGEAGVLRVATLETLTPWLLAPTIQAWHRRHPEVDFELSEFTSTARMDSVMTSQYADLIVGPKPARTAHHVEPLGREEMVVVAGGAHAFAARPAVSVAALTDQPFIRHDPDVDDLASRHKLTLTPVLHTRNQCTAAALAMAGLGVTIVPVSALCGRDDGTVRPLQPQLYRDIVATLAAPTDQLTRRFVADLQRRGLPGDGRARAAG
ncbi:LysR family transcriptional regulator [Actinoplanes sp. TBRC 11911]|uniref:LysR family transcriptional regulator n=1 Tax=Actinoplanes sp. TBRC 11911 TaxID=2729386 RepID=UPI00145F3839|nr:LysR family transcriptional regulator [Actinoplanes sp. TBRC 11911]NMO49735.1 LysR family transcriptional regulator [Actinoplanes sp. TBRC 11911]